MKDIKLEIETVWIAIAIIVLAFLVCTPENGIHITITHEYKGVMEAKAIAQSAKLYTEVR